MNQNVPDKERDDRHWVSRVVRQGLWLGPLIVFAGALTYFMIFARFPALRDFPWINVPVLWAGLCWSGWAAWKNLQAGPGLVRRLLGVAGFGCALMIALVFHWYVFYFSYQMPQAQPRTLALEKAPDFDLLDPDGRHVRLSDLRGRKVVLVFYRGHW